MFSDAGFRCLQPRRSGSYFGPRWVSNRTMDLRVVRLLIVIGGILLPYIAALISGSPVATSTDPGAVLFLGFFNSICWGSMLLATLGYRRAESAVFPIVIGFAWPAAFYL